MSEQNLRERFDDLVEQQPPMRGGSADDVRRGHHRLRLRRAVGVGATTAAVVAVVLGGPAVRGLVPSGAPAYTGSTGAAPTIVERCTRTDNGALDPVTFGDGSRVLTSETSPSGEVSAVVLSADGRTWGSCWLSGDPTSEFNGYASAYPIQPPAPGRGYRETNDMSFGRGHFTYVDRFPSDVSRVRVQIDAHRYVEVSAVDGFVAFAEDVPGLSMNDNPSFDVTLYGADGKILADKAMAHSDNSLPKSYRTLVPAKPLPHGGAGR